MELRAEFLQSINPLFESDRLLSEAMYLIKGLLSREKKAQAVVAQNDSDEEIETGLRQAFKELKAVKEGKIETRDFFEVVNEL
jgi:hypothetical protein